ncbi:hypothetical protein OIE62_15955 [Streptomyces scopuliridis]|uniref:Uncharacterized protein n=1 Tax=Streptomyces scopuliridis TaxID=452529 RepID=A0ACD4ZP09_9ACTN|nr:hypothetical protein [Streptomyces scopuliridis]WSB99928.1 hypothetical protein OG835_25000 [Streptomyces scopuliridis]WSC06373.1 hypothetical protein OIE62_15955 [Streptomyces scopuliridis]
MRDAIARALVWMLRLLLPARGKHTAEHPAPVDTPTPQPAANPWSKPWTSPTREQARELFRLQAETTMELGIVQRERRAAVLLADIGIDYPYTYDGAPFPAAAFVQPQTWKAMNTTGRRTA